MKKSVRSHGVKEIGATFVVVPCADNLLGYCLEMPYSNTWFRDNAQAAFEIYVSEFPIKNYLEIGVCEGQSMQWMFENFDLEDVVGIDPWPGPNKKNKDRWVDVQKNFLENMDGNEAITMYHLDSYEGLARLVVEGKRNYFDAVYIDGDHSAYNCMHDMIVSYELLKEPYRIIEHEGKELKVGGLMIIDDLNRRWQRQPLVRIAEHSYELVMQTRMLKVWQHGRQCGYVRIA